MQRGQRLTSQQDGTTAVVSVIIPAFNAGTYILETVESVLTQTYSPIEIIVVDDGSTDDTRQKLTELISHSRIRYVRQENKGLSAARNAGIRLATGKYLQFLDADDLIEPTKLEKQVRLLERSLLPSICGCDFRLFDGSNHLNRYGGDSFRGKIPFNRTEELFAFSTVIHRWLFPASLVRQLNGFDESRPDVWVMEDWLMLWKLSALGTNVLYVDEPLALYRRHSGNMTADIEKAVKGHFIALDYVENFQRKHQLNFYSCHDLKALRETYHYELGLHFLRSNRAFRAYANLVRSLVLSTRRRQAKLLLLLAVPFLRGRAIEWARSADRSLWQWRSWLRRSRSANLLQSLRRKIFEWRQRRPLKRLAAVVAFSFAGPAVSVIHRMRSPLSSKTKPRRILAIHFGGLGDTLMLTPALRALKERLPQARLDVLTLHPHVSDAFRDHPRIDSITTLPAYSGRWIVSKFANLAGAKLLFTTIRYYSEVLLRCVFGRYDVAINFGSADFDRRLGNALMYCLGIPIRIAAPTTDERLVTHPVATNQASQHRVDSYFDFLKPLGITKGQPVYEYPVSRRDVQNVQKLLLNRKIDRSRQLAVIHPGGKLHVNSRRWPAEYFAHVCDYLFSEGFEVVLTGDRDDVAVCEEVARLSNHQAQSIAGQLTFSETAALLGLGDLALTNDTATLHLAEAVGVSRVISIFGPTDPSLLAPQSVRHISFQSSLPCAPCMGGVIDSNTERCWRDVKEECLLQTTPAQVISVLRELYGARNARVASA